MQVRSLALLIGLNIQCCHELQCRSQMRLGSLVAVAVVQAYTAPIRPLTWEVPYGLGAAIKKKKKKKWHNNVAPMPYGSSQARDLIQATAMT